MLIGCELIECVDSDSQTDIPTYLTSGCGGRGGGATGGVGDGGEGGGTYLTSGCGGRRGGAARGVGDGGGDCRIVQLLAHRLEGG